MLRGTWYYNKEIKVENGLESAKIVTNVQTFRDCALQRKRQEMRLTFRLGTCQPRGLNADFQFIWSSRARAQRNFLILNLLLVSVALKH